MRIRLLSDLHLEAAPWTWKPAGEDLLILAGDIGDQSPGGWGRRRRLWSEIEAAGIPALYVVGNHEGYDDWVQRDELRRRLESELPPRIRLLDRDAYDFRGVRFLGCTLWTDFSMVDGIQRFGVQLDQFGAMMVAQSAITDFHYLCLNSEPGKKPVRVSPSDLAAWHYADRTWLAEQIRLAREPVVVVTHFLPGPGSVAEQYRRNALTPYFATDCRALMTPPVVLWLHGHTHVPCDYMHGTVRVVCNPRGYGDGNNGFSSSKIIEI